MRQKRKFTTEEENTIKALHEDGIDIKTIAKGLHCHHKLVAGFIKETYGVNAIPKVGRKRNPNKPQRVKVVVDKHVINKESESKSEDTYDDFPSDMKACTWEEGKILTDEIVDCIKSKRVQCPYLINYLNVTKDYLHHNAIVGHTHFDILIPGMKIVIINVRNKDEWNQYGKRFHIDGFRFGEYLNKNNVYTIMYNFNGVEGIVKELESRAEWRATHHC